METGRRDHRVSFLLTLTVTAVVAALFFSGGFDAIENISIDHRLLRQVREPTSGVVIIAIDGRSLDALGQWPWPREPPPGWQSRRHERPHRSSRATATWPCCQRYASYWRSGSLVAW